LILDEYYNIHDRIKKKNWLDLDNFFNRDYNFEFDFVD
jgi:hypothetical protein